MRYAVIFLILCSCSSASKLKRAEKLIVEAEAMGAKWHVDTVTAEIPVPVHEIHVKEIHHALLGDTVTIIKDRLQIKYVRLKGDSVFVEGKCKADTIYKKIPVTIVRTIKAKQGFSLWQLVVLAIVALLAGYGGGAFFKR